MLITLMTQNIQFGAVAEGRWDGLVDTIRAVGPDLLLLQECDELADPDHREDAERALGMRVAVAPSNNLPTAVAWNLDLLDMIEVETKYYNTLHHGYCAPRFDVLGLGVPLVAISTHLTPYSAQAAAQEAQLVGTRAYRHGGAGSKATAIKYVATAHPERFAQDPVQA
jgi:endonuclease/exonuclease/phosphatase family metal-dependent hydrolase